MPDTLTGGIGHHGHVFQNRFKSLICEEEPYFLELVPKKQIDIKYNLGYTFIL